METISPSGQTIEQLVRAADSVGANIAESHLVVYHYGEKLQLSLLCARQSVRNPLLLAATGDVRLLEEDSAVAWQELIEPLAKSIEQFIKSLRTTQRHHLKQDDLTKKSKECEEAYLADAKIAQSLNRTISSAPETSLFTEEEIQWLTNFANAS